jgi:hypothetical protein
MSKDLENNNGDNSQENFGLPEDYFQRSAGSILNKIEWLEEHAQYPRLNALKDQPKGFIVPENYFQKSEVLLELLNYPGIAKPKPGGFVVPENYFEEKQLTGPGKVLIESENELQAYGILKAIPKHNAFAVDENYFAASGEKIISALTNESKGGRVIKLFSAGTWYSAAAVLAITLGIWVYSQYFNVEQKDCGTLACVDRADLEKAKTQALENIDDEELYKLVDSKKLEEKLEKRSGTSGKKNDSLNDIDTEDVIDNIY